MLKIVLYKFFVYYSTYNIQAIDFNNNGELIYTINKKINNIQTFDVFKYVDKKKSRIKLFSDLLGHGDTYRYGNTILKKNKNSYFLKNQYGEILFTDWWKKYGKALINHKARTIDFISLKHGKIKIKGTFQGMALNNKFAVFALSYFNRKTKKLLKNIIYVYDINKKITYKYDLNSLDLGKYSIKNKIYKYYELEGLTYYKGDFYFGIVITKRIKKKHKKIILIVKLILNNNTKDERFKNTKYITGTIL